MGIKEEKSLSTAAELRSAAIAQLEAEAPKTALPGTIEQMQRLLHELQVHEIELDMQNAELRQVRNETELLLEKYTALYDFAPSGHLTLDRTGTICEVNLYFARLIEMERSLLHGCSFGFFVEGKDRKRFSDFLDKLFVSQAKETCELSLISKSHSELVVQLDALADPSGEECRVAVTDITGRKSAEKELGKKRLQLEELNRSLELRINEAVDELRQRDQLLILRERQALMGEMIDNIAHQWRQPLNNLGLLIQQVPFFHDSGECSSEFLEENSAKAMELIQQMSRTINDFRNFFRSDKQKILFSINQVIAQVLSLLGSSFSDQGISIYFSPEKELYINGYPNEYSQVLMNILMNARDEFFERETVDPRIDIRCFDDGERPVVTVTDNAGGVASGIIERLFDPFFSTKGPDKGTGIGLYMSKIIIEKNMGGRLSVSNTDKGAELRIEV